MTAHARAITHEKQCVQSTHTWYHEEGNADGLSLVSDVPATGYEEIDTPSSELAG